MCVRVQGRVKGPEATWPPVPWPSVGIKNRGDGVVYEFTNSALPFEVATAATTLWEGTSE